MMNRFKVWSIADKEGLAYGEARWYVHVQNNGFGFSRRISRDHALTLIKQINRLNYDMWEDRDADYRVMQWQVLKIVK